MQNVSIRNLKKSLNDLCNNLDHLYNINEGGCCFLTYLIAYHLDILKIKYKLVIYSEISKNLDEIKKEITTKHVNNSNYTSVIGEQTCLHYTLCIDNVGVINIMDECKFCKQYSINNVNHNHIKWIYKKGDWNYVYDIRNNKRIRKILFDFFKTRNIIKQYETRK